MMTPPNNYYTVLSVPPDATPEQLRSAFRRAVLKHHPDKNNNSRASQDHVILLKQAYDALSDPERRAQHDLRLAHHEADQRRLQQQARSRQEAVSPRSPVSTNCGPRIYPPNKAAFDRERRQKILWLKSGLVVAALCFAWFLLLQPMTQAGSGTSFNPPSTLMGGGPSFVAAAFWVSLLFGIFRLLRRGGWVRLFLILWLTLEALCLVAFRLVPRIDSGAFFGLAFLDTGASDWTESVNRGDSLFLSLSLVTTTAALFLGGVWRLVAVIGRQRV